MTQAPLVTFEPASADDAEALVTIRIAAMRESLERIGRFDPQRARDRFLSGFEPALTRHVLLDASTSGTDSSWRSKASGATSTDVRRARESSERRHAPECH